MFDNYQDVCLEITIGTETLAPRTKIQAVRYAIDATNAENAVSADASVNANNAWTLNHQSASYDLDTSSTRRSAASTSGTGSSCRRHRVTR